MSTQKKKQTIVLILMQCYVLNHTETKFIHTDCGTNQLAPECENITLLFVVTNLPM